MNGRAMSAIFLLLVMLAVGLVSTPVLSGEHPWDSDLTGEEDPVLAEYGWDTRAADSAQLDTEQEDVDTDGAAAPASVSSTLPTTVLSFLSALSIGI